MLLKNDAEAGHEGEYKTHLRIDTQPPSNTQTTASRASLCVSTGSDSMFELASSWLATCTAEHEYCKTFATTLASAKDTRTRRRVPKYLVEINPSPGIEYGYTSRLIETSIFPPNSPPQWVTLSHCWGPSPIFCTTSANIKSNMSQLPLGKLPKTFLDAMTIASRLGHQYLWIDSLCIIQDSTQHWNEELEIMGDVYLSSAFTIAASGATDGTIGCFR